MRRPAEGAPPRPPSATRPLHRTRCHASILGNLVAPSIRNSFAGKSWDPPIQNTQMRIGTQAHGKTPTARASDTRCASVTDEKPTSSGVLRREAHASHFLAKRNAGVTFMAITGLYFDTNSWRNEAMFVISIENGVLRISLSSPEALSRKIA